MRVWMHKETGDLCLSRPCIDVAENLENDCYIYFKQHGDTFNIGFAPVVHTGWLIENAHGVAFWANLEAIQYFEDLGEL
jgi:hypothetical protein